MLGFVRFILALLVLLNHLWLPVANQLGATAVIGFYTVSGFLMTKVITEVYHDGLRGALAFAANRMLRIYPCYFLVLVLSIIFLVAFETTFGNFYSSMKLPETDEQWFSNITLINIVDQPRVIIPPAWSLNIEMLFYGLMIIVLSRSRLMIELWFVASCIATIYLLWSGASFAERYYPPLAASLWFSVGALLYVAPSLRQLLIISERNAFLFLLAFCLFPIGVRTLGLDSHTLGFYGGYLLFLPVFVTALEPSSTIPSALDRYLGDLAYPIFVAHFMVGGLLHALTDSWLQPYGITFVVLAMIGTWGFAHIFAVSVDQRIQTWRSIIRPVRVAVG